MARQVVVVNLSIDSESTRILGAHSHIAEVQLLLDAFADVQAPPTPSITCPNFIPGSLAGCPAGRAPGPCLLSGQLIRLTLCQSAIPSKGFSIAVNQAARFRARFPPPVTVLLRSALSRGFLAQQLAKGWGLFTSARGRARKCPQTWGSGLSVWRNAISLPLRVCTLADGEAANGFAFLLTVPSRRCSGPGPDESHPPACPDGHLPPPRQERELASGWHDRYTRFRAVKAYHFARAGGAKPRRVAPAPPSGGGGGAERRGGGSRHGTGSRRGTATSSEVTKILADIKAAEVDADPELAGLAGCSALIASGSVEAGPVESDATAETAEARARGDDGGWAGAESADPGREVWPCTPRAALRREALLGPDPDAEQPPSVPGSPAPAVGRPAANSPPPATSDPLPPGCYSGAPAQAVGAELVSGMSEALLAVFQRGARRPGGELDRLTTRVAGAHALSSAGSAWFTRFVCWGGGGGWRG
jgi:hypothetical protein